MHLFIRTINFFRSLAVFAILAGLIFFGPNAQSGITIQLQFYRDNSASPYYLFFAGLATNDVGAVPDNTGYFVWSASSTINSGLYAQLLPDGTNPSGGQGYSDNYDSLAADLTNLWTLQVTNATSTNTYNFKFSVFSSNALPVINVGFPTNNEVNVTNLPTFAWTGPTNYDSLFVQVTDNENNGFVENDNLPVSQTSWTSPQTLPYALSYTFLEFYSRDASTVIVSSTPTNSLGQSVADWNSTASLTSQIGVVFTVNDPFNGGTVPLRFALNDTNLTWTTNGDAPWFGEYPISNDGVAAAQSGELLDGQTSVLQTTVTGPGTLSFYWQTRGESDNFTLDFSIDGSLQNELGADDNFWQQQSYSIASGTHTITWTASANSGSATNDAAFVDEVSFAGYAPPAPGAWTATAATPIGLILQTTTLLTNGTAMVAGGSDNSGTGTNEVLIYNPTTRAFTNAAPLNNARFAHTATRLTNGTVLVAGGITIFAASGLVQTAELYDPVAQTWSNTAPMHFPRYSHTATLLTNGMVFVAGGYGTNPPNVNLTNVYPTELYDPVARTWTNGPSLKLAREYHTATLLPNGKVLIAGGETTNATLATAECELYDPATGTISVTGGMPYPLEHHTATLLTNGTVLVAGGDINFGSFGGESLVPVQFAEIYDPNTEMWTSTGNLVKAHDNHTATLLTNGLVLIAGYSSFNSTNDSAELFDPVAGMWSLAGPMLFPVQNQTATLLPDGSVLAVGGLITTCELYNAPLVTLPTTIVLTNFAHLSGGGFQFAWTNLAGSSNEVIYSTNAATAISNWTILSGATEVSPGHFQFTDGAATNSHQRFYKVRSP